MNNQVREVTVRSVLPLEGSFAVFLGDGTKTFVIYVDESVGTAISMFMRGIAKERPLTHDLMATVLLAFGAKVERVVINDVNGAVFYARLILAAENQLGSRKVVELDARPSDSIAMAMQQGASIYVAEKVWNTVEDVTATLEQIEARALEEASNEPAIGESEEDEEDDDDDDDDDFTEDDLFDEDDDDADDDEEDDDDEDDDFDFDDDDDDDDDKPESPRSGSSTF